MKYEIELNEEEVAFFRNMLIEEKVRLDNTVNDWMLFRVASELDKLTKTSSPGEGLDAL